MTNTTLKYWGFDQNRGEETEKMELCHCIEMKPLLNIMMAYGHTLVCEHLRLFPDHLQFTPTKLLLKHLIQTEACVDSENFRNGKIASVVWQKEATDLGLDWAPER